MRAELRRGSFSGFTVLLVLALVLEQRHGVARPRLLVLNAERQPVRLSLVEALRFQLRESTEVAVSPALLEPGPIAARISRASEIVTGAQARFAIWLESTKDADGAAGFLLFVVGGRSSRAVIEVVRLPATTDGPDVDRSLALKVSDIVESALDADMPAFGSALNREPPVPAASATTAASGTTAASSPIAPEVVALKTESQQPQSASHVEVQFGGMLLSPSGTANGQLGARLGLGYVAATAALELELSATAELRTPQSSASESGHVRTTEQAACIGLGIRSRGLTQFGVGLEGGFRWLHAQGYWGLQRTGAESLLVPALRLGPELRRQLWQRGWLALSVAGEWMPVQRKFTVRDAPAADWGRVRADALFSFVVSLP